MQGFVGGVYVAFVVFPGDASSVCVAVGYAVNDVTMKIVMTMMIIVMMMTKRKERKMGKIKARTRKRMGRRRERKMMIPTMMKMMMTTRKKVKGCFLVGSVERGEGKRKAKTMIPMTMMTMRRMIKRKEKEKAQLRQLVKKVPTVRIKAKAKMMTVMTTMMMMARKEEEERKRRKDGSVGERCVALILTCDYTYLLSCQHMLLSTSSSTPLLPSLNVSHQYSLVNTTYYTTYPGQR